MPENQDIQTDEFGIPVKRKPVSTEAVDDFGIPIKKKSGGVSGTPKSSTGGIAGILDSNLQSSVNAGRDLALGKLTTTKAPVPVNNTTTPTPNIGKDALDADLDLTFSINLNNPKRSDKFSLSNLNALNPDPGILSMPREQQVEAQKRQIKNDPTLLKEYRNKRMQEIKANKKVAEVKKSEATAFIPVSDNTTGIVLNPIEVATANNEIEAADYYEKELQKSVEAAAKIAVPKSFLAEGIPIDTKKVGQRYLETIGDPTIGDNIVALEGVKNNETVINPGVWDEVKRYTPSEVERTQQGIEYKLDKNGSLVMSDFFTSQAEELARMAPDKITAYAVAKDRRAKATTRQEQQELDQQISVMLADETVSAFQSALGEAEAFAKRYDTVADHYPQVKRAQLRQKMNDAFMTMTAAKDIEDMATGRGAMVLLRSIFGSTPGDSDIKRIAELTGTSVDEARKIIDEGGFFEDNPYTVRVKGFLQGIAGGAKETLAKSAMGIRRFINADNVAVDNAVDEANLEEYNMSAQANKLFDDAGKLNINPYSIFNTMGHGVGQTAVFAAPALVTGGLASVGSVAARLIEAGTTIASGYAGSYEDAYKEAARYTADEDVRRGYANITAIENAVPELLMSPASIVKKIGGITRTGAKGTFENFIKGVAENGLDKTVAQRVGSFAKEFGNVVLAENVEEATTNITNNLTKQNMLGVSMSGDDWLNQTIETAIQTTLTTMPLGIGAGIGANRDVSGVRKEAYFEAGNEPQLYKTKLQDLADQGSINQEQLNKYSQVVNTMAEIVAGVNKLTKPDGTAYSYSEKADLAAQQFRIVNNNAILKDNPIDGVKGQVEADNAEALAIQNSILSPKIDTDESQSGKSQSGGQNNQGGQSDQRGNVQPQQVPGEEIQPVKTSDVAEPVSSDASDNITVGEVVDRQIIYKGQRARVYQDGQTVVVKIEGEPKEFELGNIEELKDTPIGEFGIDNEESVVSLTDSGDVVVRGETFQNKYSDPLAAINYDKDGYVVSVNLDMPNGTKRTFRGTIADDIAYQITLQQITKDNESRQQFEDFLGTDEAFAADTQDGAVQEIAQEETTGDNIEVQREKVIREIKPENNVTVQESSTEESLLRNEGVQRESELPGVGQQDTEETANQVQEKVIPSIVKSNGEVGRGSKKLISKALGGGVVEDSEFSNTQVTNEDGTPKKVFHGTWADAPFEDFKEGDTYFTDNYDTAKMFGINREGGVDVENIDIQGKPFVMEVTDNNGERHTRVIAHSDMRLIFSDLNYDVSPVGEWGEEDFVNFDINSIEHHFGIPKDKVKSFKIEERKVGENVDEFGVSRHYINIEKPLLIDAKGDVWNGSKGGAIQEKINEARSSGKYDGVIVENIVEGGLLNPDTKPTTTYVVFNNPQNEPTEVPESSKGEESTASEPNKDKQRAKTPPPAEGSNATEDEEAPVGITQASLDEMRKELGFGPYEREKVTDSELSLLADRIIADGYPIKKLLTKMEGGADPNPLETVILGKFKPIIHAEAIANPTDENLQLAFRFADTIAKNSSDLGRKFRLLRFTPNDEKSSVVDIMVDMMNDYDVTTLTDAQKEEAQQKWDTIAKAVEKEAQLRIEAEAEIERLKAENELLKAKRENKANTPAKRNKTAEDYRAERTKIVNSMKDKWNNAKNDGTLSSDLPFRKQLAAIAPDVFRLIGSYAEQGIDITLDEVRKLLKKDIQDAGIDINDDEIRSLIAGKYNEKKPPRSELSKAVQDLREEEALLLQEEALEKGVIPNSEKGKIQRNQKLKDIRDRIEALKKKNGVGRYSSQARFETSVKSRIAANKKAQQDFLDKIKHGNYSEEDPDDSILENAELKKDNKKLYDDYLQSIIDKDKALLDYEKSRLDNQIKNMGKLEKLGDYTNIALATSKGAVAMFDQSGVLVQMLIPTLSHPLVTLKNLPSALRDLVDKKWFDKRMAKLKNSKAWDVIKESGLAIMDPEGVSDNVRQELLGGRKNLLNRNIGIRGTEFSVFGKKIKIKGGDLNVKGKTFSVGKAFERSTSSLFNNMRLYLFLNQVENLYKAGKTFDTHPDEFKAAARAVNELTGHGKVPTWVSEGAPVINQVIWSPKMMASTFNVIGLGDVIRPTESIKAVRRAMGNKNIKFNPDKSRGFYSSLTPAQGRFVRNELARFILSSAVIMLAVKLLGGDDDEVDMDPLSITFGNIKTGDKSINVFGRYGAAVRVIAQLAMSQRNIEGKKDILGDKFGDKKGADILNSSFGRGKMTPFAGVVYDYLLNGKTHYFTKEKMTLKNAAKSLAVPISFQDFAKDFKRDGPVIGSLETLFKIYGGNIRDKDDFKKQPKK